MIGDYIMKNNSNNNTKPNNNPKDAIKNRLSSNAVKPSIEKFCKEQQEIYIALNNDSAFPLLEVADYRYINGSHILILTPASIFLNQFQNNTKFSGFIFDKLGSGLKMSKRIYGNFVCQSISTDHQLLQELSLSDPLIKKMLSHGAKFFLLNSQSLKAYLSHSEIFDLDENMTPSFAKFAPNGKERFENARHVLMEYQSREVIFNTIIENGTYYTLTKADSNKISYIKSGEECLFYDGIDAHFSSKVDIIQDSNKVQEVFDKLIASNHSYFKSIDGLVALSYTNNN